MGTRVYTCFLLMCYYLTQYLKSKKKKNNVFTPRDIFWAIKKAVTRYCLFCALARECQAFVFEAYVKLLPCGTYCFFGSVNTAPELD